MSIHVDYYEWKSAQECLEWLFDNHADMQTYKCLHLWQESFASLNGSLAGSYQAVTPAMLADRIYTARFVNDSIGICYHDEVFAPVIENNKQRCRKIRITLPMK